MPLAHTAEAVYELSNRTRAVHLGVFPALVFAATNLTCATLDLSAAPNFRCVPTYQWDRARFYIRKCVHKLTK